MAAKRRNTIKAQGDPRDRTIRAAFEKWIDEVSALKKTPERLLQEFQAFCMPLIRNREPAERTALLTGFAEELFHKCLTPSDTEANIIFQLWLGHACETFGAWRQSLTAFQLAAELSVTKAHLPYKSEAQLWAGHILLMQSRGTDALKAYRQSLQSARESGDEKVEANAYNGLAYYHFEKGELGKARSHWEKALELAETVNDTMMLAKVNNNLGAVANVQGQWEKALARYGESIPLFEKIGELRGVAEACHNMALTHADAGRWSEAGSYYGQSYQLAKEIGDVRLQATVKLNRVELSMALGDFRLAEALCHQALRAFTTLSDHLGKADVYKFLGMLMARKEDWQEAATYFRKSIRLARKFESPLCEAETHLEHARMLKQKGERQSARRQYDLALGLFTRLKAGKEIRCVKKELSQLSSGK